MLRKAVRRVVVGKGLGPFDRYVRALSSHAWVGDWVRAHPTEHTFTHRFEMYKFLQANHLGGGPIDYLEFGVWRGETIRLWSEQDRDPASRFWGFDSFEGLPEDWAGSFKTMPKGTFDTGGALPAIDDARVGFVKGWFQTSLPPFLETFRPRNRLVVHCDADLYTSTLYVLCKLDPILKPGSIVIFDEFSSADGEARALVDYSSSFLRKYKILCKTGEFCDQVAIEIL
jgi:O-methyltransferase